MDFLSLIPAPDTIPAPAWLFLVLDLLTFTLHILMINIIVGGSLITLFNRMGDRNHEPNGEIHAPVTGKIPTLFAIGINLGVAPLLFLQVIYGHLFYTSSVLMAVYWILVIPFLILAYYGAYIHSRRYDAAPLLSKAALWGMTLLVLYIAFMLVNNNTLMLEPERWTVYFDNRGGTLLNLGDPTLLPRYLHFVTASVAVAGLFLAVLWSRRQKRPGEKSVGKVRSALKIFAWATVAQMLVGVWFLLALPRAFMLNFMGGAPVVAGLLLIGLLGGLGAIFTALKGKLAPTLSMALATLVVMVINRQNLRAMYLEDVFRLDSLALSPQYGILALFLIVLAAGVAAVVYMLKISGNSTEGRAAS